VGESYWRGGLPKSPVSTVRGKEKRSRASGEDVSILDPEGESRAVGRWWMNKARAFVTIGGSRKKHNEDPQEKRKEN